MSLPAEPATDRGSETAGETEVHDHDPRLRSRRGFDLVILVALAGPIEGAGRPDTANIMGYWNRRARAEAPRLSPSQQNIVDNTLRNGNRRMLLTRWFD